MTTKTPGDDRLLHATIATREGHHATLLTDDGQSLVVPTALLPHGAEQGSDVWIAFHTTASLDAERRASARALLEEIMNPEA